MRRKRHPGNKRVSTVAWRDDPEIIQRVGVVATLYFQPAATALVAVNQWCRARGMAEVSYETIKADRAKGRELLRDESGEGARERIFELEQQRASVWRDIAASTPGAGRAPLYSEARQLTMNIARMEGSIPPAGVDREFGEPSVRMDELPTPDELLESGRLSREDYDSYLRGVALMVNGGGGMGGAASQ